MIVEETILLEAAYDMGLKYRECLDLTPGEPYFLVKKFGNQYYSNIEILSKKSLKKKKANLARKVNAGIKEIIKKRNE